MIKVYDGLTLSQTFRLDPQKYTVVEGLWTFNKTFLSKLFDLKVYVEASPDVRLMRRLIRDVIRARECTLSQMLSYYMECIRPLHLKFVEPAKNNCEVLVSGESQTGSEAKRVLETLNRKLSAHLQ